MLSQNHSGGGKGARRALTSGGRGSGGFRILAVLHDIGSASATIDATAAARPLLGKAKVGGAYTRDRDSSYV
jgi:hypothetical protein